MVLAAGNTPGAAGPAQHKDDRSLPIVCTWHQERFKQYPDLLQANARTGAS